VLHALPHLVFLAVLGLLTCYALKVARFFFVGLDQDTITLVRFDCYWI
jgi:hypothetical protein